MIFNFRVKIMKLLKVQLKTVIYYFRIYNAFLVKEITKKPKFTINNNNVPPLLRLLYPKLSNEEYLSLKSSKSF